MFLDTKVMKLGKGKELNSSSGTSMDFDDVSDDQYWLQYVVFDILYVDGPGAKDLISKSSNFIRNF